MRKHPLFSPSASSSSAPCWSSGRLQTQSSDNRWPVWKRRRDYLFLLLFLSYGSWFWIPNETVLLLHHEQHGWDDEARVGRVAEKRPHECRQVQVYGFHDHVKHLGFPAAQTQTPLYDKVALTKHVSKQARWVAHLKGPQSNEGGRVMIV